MRGRMIVVALLCGTLTASQAGAVVVCQKGQKIRLRPTECKGKETLVQDLAQAAQPGPKGDPGTARAYAEVDVAGPTLVAARTAGFVSVERTGTGIYCLVAEDGIGPTTNPAVVSASGPLNSNAAAYTAPPTVACPNGYVVAVKDGVSLDDTTNFTIIVP